MKRWVAGLVLVMAGVPAMAMAKHADKEVTGTLNLNQASESQLVQLPGIGPKVAKQIVEYRTQKPFEKPGDVRHVKGVGRATYEKIKDHIAVEGRSSLTAVTSHGAAGKSKPSPKGRSASSGMAR
jgi:competence protein ComEA